MTTVARILFEVCLVFMMIGSINWGLFALDPSNDIIVAVFPTVPLVRSLFYFLICVAGIVAAYIWLSYPDSVCTLSSE